MTTGRESRGNRDINIVLGPTDQSPRWPTESGSKEIDIRPQIYIGVEGQVSITINDPSEPRERVGNKFTQRNRE